MWFNDIYACNNQWQGTLQKAKTKKKTSNAQSYWEKVRYGKIWKQILLITFDFLTSIFLAHRFLCFPVLIRGCSYRAYNFFFFRSPNWYLQQTEWSGYCWSSCLCLQTGSVKGLHMNHLSALLAMQDSGLVLFPYPKKIKLDVQLNIRSQLFQL